MKKYILLISIIFFLGCENEAEIKAQQPEVVEQKTDSNLLKLQKAYPDFIIGVNDNEIIWFDSTTMIFDDGIERTFDEMLVSPSLKDMFYYKYTAFKLDTPTVNFDPGRFRNDAFFKKMYGSTQEEARKNIVTITWLPSSVNQKILVTKVNGVNEKLQAISNELDTMVEFQKYLTNIGGTFNWRVIAGTDRLSSHSFGIAIDINVKYSNYWLWDKNQGHFNAYKNKIPLEIVNVFEKHGFIWGGKWYHYDTMHFEYRPEIL